MKWDYIFDENGKDDFAETPSDWKTFMKFFNSEEEQNHWNLFFRKLRDDLKLNLIIDEIDGKFYKHRVYPVSPFGIKVSGDVKSVEKVEAEFLKHKK